MTDKPNSPTGTLEINEKSGTGFLRDPLRNYAESASDPTISRDVIRKLRLRGGESISGSASSVPPQRGQQQRRPQRGQQRGPQRGPQRGQQHDQRPAPTLNVQTINNKRPDEHGDVTPFDELTVISPIEQLKFATPDGPMTMRVVDLWTPIGKGQRALIVAPPRTGKTILLQHLAHGIKVNHPEVFLMMLLIDERPEEVTEMRRSVGAEGAGWQHGVPEVVYSSNDKDARSHGRIARLMIEKAKRHVELGEDVVVLLDSLTRLGRAFNHLVGSSGRTMTGGLDIRALEIPKQLFGAARKIENGGSLTIIASALIETGSRMDEFIFQEFKGTGNMELVLSREIADRRVWPAIDLAQSGTRKEELLLSEDTCNIITRLRRRLLSMPLLRQVETLLAEFGKFKSNEEYLKHQAT